MAKTNELLDIDKLIGQKINNQLQPPGKYQVVLLNDDYTPMEFVTEVLQKYFAHNIETATQIMLTIHYQGKAICGVYTAEIAETKVMQVNQYAQDNEYPLLCTLEKTDC